jgi:hypothetical protein
MASRHQRIETIEAYSYLHVNAVQASRTQLPTTPAAGQPALDLGHGVWLQRITVNDPGATQVLTIFNGNVAGNVVAVIKPSTCGFIDFGILLEQGFWYTLSAGTVGDFTVCAAPVPV